MYNTELTTATVGAYFSYPSCSFFFYSATILAMSFLSLSQMFNDGRLVYVDVPREII